MKYMIFCINVFNVNVVNYKLSQTFEKNILLKSFICSTKKFMQELRKYKLINYKKQKLNNIKSKPMLKYKYNKCTLGLSFF